MNQSLTSSFVDVVASCKTSKILSLYAPIQSDAIEQICIFLDKKKQDKFASNNHLCLSFACDPILFLDNTNDASMFDSVFFTCPNHIKVAFSVVKNINKLNQLRNIFFYVKRKNISVNRLVSKNTQITNIVNHFGTNEFKTNLDFYSLFFNHTLASLGISVDKLTSFQDESFDYFCVSISGSVENPELFHELFSVGFSDKKEAKNEYTKYLSSNKWKRVCLAKKEEAGYKCQRCFVHENDAKLIVHHETYDRIGCELLSDLLLLCRSCHRIRHEEAPWIKFNINKLDQLNANKKS